MPKRVSETQNEVSCIGISTRKRPLSLSLIYSICTDFIQESRLFNSEEL